MNKKRVPAICPALALVMVCSGVVHADTFEWTNAVLGDFDDPTKWTNTNGASPAPPGTGDGIEFNEPGFYPITLNADESVDEIRGLNGSVTLISDSATVRTLKLATGSADANISGGSLQIGTTTKPVFLNLANVSSGGGLSTSVMNIGSQADGTVSVIGPDSRLDVLGATNQSLGFSGNTGTLIVSSGATANFGSNGTINLADSSNSGSQGNVLVDLGGTLNTGHIDLAPQTSGATGVMTVDGSGSSINQTLAGANTTIGSASGGTGTLNVQSSGLFNSGTGTTTLKSTGAVNLTGGDYQANGDMIIDGGLFTRTDGTFSLAANKTLTVQNLGSIDWSGPGQGFTLDQPGSSVDLITATLLAYNSVSQPAIVIRGGAQLNAHTEATIETHAMHLEEGTVNISGFDTHLRFMSGSAADNRIGSDTSPNNATLNITGEATVANQLGASPDFQVNASGGGTATVNVNSNADLTVHNIMIDGVGNDAINVNGGNVVQLGNSNLTIGNTASDDLRINITNSGFFSSAPEGLTTVTDGGTIHVSGFGSSFQARGDVDVNGGTIEANNNISSNFDGVFELSPDKTMTISNGGLVELAGGYWFQNDTTHVIDDGGTMIINDNARFYDTGTVDLVGGTLQFGSGVADKGGSLNFAAGTVRSTSPFTPLFINHDGFILDSMNLGISQTFTLFDGEIEIAGLTLAEAGADLYMTNGHLNLSALTMATGSAFYLSGQRLTQDGPLLTAIGSTLTFVGSSSSTSLGDPNAYNGVVIAGTLDVQDNTITLLDANDAVLDSGALVKLGKFFGPANLVAANGLTLDFGGNIIGAGTVTTPNDPFKPFINNGNIIGDSPGNPITLTGYVKGVGTMDNVVITGTDAPGFSPATVYRGNMTYAGTLEVELGGTGPGSYDKLVHSGLAALGGTLDVILIGGFAPSAGDTFDILDWGSMTGAFNNINLPTLAGGIDWDTSNLLIDGTLAVVLATLPGDLDGDGFVGIDDLNIVLSNWNLNVPPGDPLADPSGDGFVGIDDLNEVLGNWNAGTPPPPIGQANIPEPGTLAVLAFGGLALFRRRAGA